MKSVKFIIRAMNNRKSNIQPLALAGICLGLFTFFFQQAKAHTEIATSNPKYPVTHTIANDLDSLQGQPAPSFEFANKENSLAKLLKKGPVVLLTLKKGCPCNLKAQPIFNTLAKKYQNKATFIGIMNSDQEAADQFTKITKANFLILSDPNQKTLRAYRAKRAGYVYLIAPDKKMQKVWAGYSQDMLAELNLKLAKLTKTPLTPFDPQYAPKEMTSGCSLE